MPTFVVMGQVGRYSDHSEWPVVVLDGTQEQAQAWMDQCAAQARDLHARYVAYSDAYWNAHPRDRRALHVKGWDDEHTEMDPECAATSLTTYFLEEVRRVDLTNAMDPV